MKHLYLMRHGETLFNVRRRIQGSCDSPLTAKGIAQAKAAGEMLSDIPFDHYYCSTAERSSDTLELVAGDVPYVRMKALKERGFGIFEGESEDLNPPRFEGDFNYDSLFPHYGGETTEQVRARVRSAIDAIMAKEDHTYVLVVSHGGACMNFLSTVTDRMDVVGTKRFGNCSVLHFTYENGSYQLLEVMTPDIKE